MKSILGVTFGFCAWQGDAVFLRARNDTMESPARAEATGLLCRETKPGSDDVDVVLEKGGRRSLLFSRVMKDSNGTVMGREVAGMQSTVHCAKEVAHPDDKQCVPADLDKPLPSCTEIGQSGKCSCAAVVNEPLKLAYQEMMVTETLKLCEAKAKKNEPLRVLMFGLGGGAVPMYIRHRCEAAHIESIESDARIATIAQRLFGFKADAKNRVEIADGEEAIERHAATHPWPTGPHYDVVLVDCFEGDNHVPHSCRSERFVRHVRTALGPDGHVFHNVMDSDVKQVLPMYKATFGDSWTWQEPVQKGQFLVHAKTHENHPRHA